MRSFSSNSLGRAFNAPPTGCGCGSDAAPILVGDYGVRCMGPYLSPRGVPYKWVFRPTPKFCNFPESPKASKTLTKEQMSAIEAARKMFAIKVAKKVAAKAAAAKAAKAAAPKAAAKKVAKKVAKKAAKRTAKKAAKRTAKKR